MSQPTLIPPWYIVIEGAIGVGKTTLARMLREYLEAELLLEVFEENPFLAKFYESRVRYAFQTQMFFLLSRYRQQRQVDQLLHQGTLIADYMFAKDRLFAQLNLANDEWEIYLQLHRALAEQIPKPQLIVYLQANTDVLMARIAQRDRPYERDMERDYIEAVRLAYEAFFASYKETPVLNVDTNPLNFVTHSADFHFILGRIRSLLQEGMVQRQLPHLEEPSPAVELLNQKQALSDYQRFQVELDKTEEFITDIYFHYLCLSEQVGGLGSELAKLWQTEARQAQKGKAEEKARQDALKEQRTTIQSELAASMAYLLKMANCVGVDLEKAYLERVKSSNHLIAQDIHSKGVILDS